MASGKVQTTTRPSFSSAGQNKKWSPGVHWKSSRRELESFHADDKGGNSVSAATSYDLLGRSCSGNAADLKNWARIRRLETSCQAYLNIEEYVKNSADSASGMSVQKIYKIERKGEREPFAERFRMLLWHGTSASNIPGIIQTGFRKGSGGLFGGGVYFADRIAKSAGYCRGSFSGTKFFVLAEVAPGKIYKAHHCHSDYKTPPPRFDSVKGMGSQIPTWKHNKFYHGAILPSGVTKLNTRHSQFDLTYNEYIIYDPSRIIVRFVVECS